MTETPGNLEDYSEDAEKRRIRRIAEEVLGLRFDEIQRSASAANMVGIQSENLLFSQRQDSRTYFVQDTRYGMDQAAGVFEGSDDELLERARSILERLDIPRSEIGEELVLKEQVQVAQVDQYGTARMEEVQEGKKLARLSRQIDGLPVWSSNHILGLTKDAQIGFMQLHWPEILSHVVTEAHKLNYQVEQGWRPPEQPGATVEAVEAGIIHSPAVGLLMDIYPVIRVIYTPVDRPGKKPTLYLDRDGHNVPIPRQFDLPPGAVIPTQPARRQDYRQSS
jgi:hypothetical protein